MSIDLDGDLDEAQRAEPERATGRCPVSPTLRHQIEMVERMRVARLLDEADKETLPANDPPPGSRAVTPNWAD